jgi:hypothetical protein
VKAGFGDNINLDSWAAARVVDRAGVDLGDSHSEMFCSEIVRLASACSEVVVKKCANVEKCSP